MLAKLFDMKDAEDPMGGRSGGAMDPAAEEDVEGRELVTMLLARFCSGRSGNMVADAILRMKRGQGFVVTYGTLGPGMSS